MLIVFMLTRFGILKCVQVMLYVKFDIPEKPVLFWLPNMEKPVCCGWLLDINPVAALLVPKPKPPPITAPDFLFAP